MSLDEQKHQKPEARKEKCPRCGNTEFETVKYGQTGMLGIVKCQHCGKEIREWNAY
jgi:transcription elongation factor Elf1